MDIIGKLKEELNIEKWQVEAVIKLIDEGNTIPFIARYRKEQHGNLSDEVLRNLIQPHVVALETHLAVGVLDLLKKTGDHERCDGRIENGTEKHLEN